MRKYLIISVLFLTLNTQAWNTRAEFESASIRALQDKWYLICDDFRTNLLALIASPIDAESQFEARIIQAVMSNEQYIHDMDLTKLIHEYNVATNYVATVQVPTNSWCSWGLPLLVGMYCVNLAEYEQAFNLATNTIDKIERGEIGIKTNVLSRACLAAQKLEGFQPLQSFKALAAASEIFAFHELIRTAVYTNDLPSHIAIVLQRMLEQYR